MPTHDRGLAAAPTRKQIDDLLVEGLDSGEPSELRPEDWAGLRRQVRRRLAANALLAEDRRDKP